MTLFIAVLLMWHFESPWWLYGIAVIVWVFHVAFHKLNRVKLWNELTQIKIEVSNVKHHIRSYSRVR